jgi:hypothetical protein
MPSSSIISICYYVEFALLILQEALLVKIYSCLGGDMELKKKLTETGEENKPLAVSRAITYGYLMGILTASFIGFLMFLFVGLKFGFGNVYENVVNYIAPPPMWERVVPNIKPVLNELSELGAVVNNAGNPTQITPHNTILVKPDGKGNSVLRPGVQLTAHFLKTKSPLNLDPPQLVLKKDWKISSQLERFIKDNSRLEIQYSVDENGFRTTLPKVKTDRKILILGASVAFCVGVNDEHTVASFMQKKLAPRFELVNAGYGGQEVSRTLEIAEEITAKEKFWGAIYIGSPKKFFNYGEESEKQTELLNGLERLLPRFNGNIAIVLHTYLEYNQYDYFLEEGAGEKRIQRSEHARKNVPQLVKKYGFSYLDWSDLVESFREKERTVFADFVLYTDHSHLSPRGNEMMAEELVKIVNNDWSR